MSSGHPYRDRSVKIAFLFGYFCVLLNATLLLGQSRSDSLQEAHSLLEAGKLQESETIARNYLSRNPSSAEGHFLLGEILFHEHKAPDSLAEFTAGAKFQRPGPRELRIVASNYVLLGDFADADKWFTEVTGETPNDPTAWYLLGRTKYNENRFAEAINSFEHVLSLHPHDVQAEDNLGLSQEGLGHADEAMAAFQNAIAWQGSAPVDAQPFLNLGILLTDRGDLAGAIKNLTEAVALAPDNPKIHEELARALVAKGDTEAAQAQLETAVKLAPNASELHFKLGQLYRRRGLTEHANQEFAICQRLNGTHSSTEVPNPFRNP
jgi:Flp pilus assembly protein TadD